MLVFLVEWRNVGDLIEGAVHLHALEALFLKFGEFLPVFALTPAHDRRKDIKTCAFLQCDDPIDHLAHRLAFDRKAGSRRIGNAHTRKEQAHIVVDFGDCAHRRTRIAACRLLLDGNGGRQAVNLVDIRFLHHFEKLTRIG